MLVARAILTFEPHLVVMCMKNSRPRRHRRPNRPPWRSVPARPTSCSGDPTSCFARTPFNKRSRGAPGGLLDPRNHTQHIVKSAPALLSHLCSPFVNDPTGLTTSFFCVCAMRRGPVPTIIAALKSVTEISTVENEISTLPFGFHEIHHPYDRLHGLPPLLCPPSLYYVPQVLSKSCLPYS